MQERDLLRDRPSLDLLFDLSDGHVGRYFRSPVPSETHSSQSTPLFPKQDASFDLSIMEVNFVAVARPPDAMDTVGWRTWAPGLPQINTKTNCILTPVVLSMSRIQKQLQNTMEINGF